MKATHFRDSCDARFLIKCGNPREGFIRCILVPGSRAANFVTPPSQVRLGSDDDRGIRKFALGKKKEVEKIGKPELGGNYCLVCGFAGLVGLWDKDCIASPLVGNRTGK